MLLYLYTQQFIQFNVNYVGDYCQGWGISQQIYDFFSYSTLSDYYIKNNDDFQ